MAGHARFHDLAVAGVEPVTDDSVAITFDVPDEVREDFVWIAGQHVTVAGDDGVRRSFSICNAPSTGILRIGVKRLPGGVFSEGVVSQLSPGDTLSVMTPAGRFVAPEHPAHTPRRVVAVAAGSGITPVLSIVTDLLEREPDAMATLVCANRTHRSVMFLDEIHDLKDRWPQRVQLVHVLSREATDSELLSGRLDGDRLRRLATAVLPVAEVDGWFLCGPQDMVAELREALSDLGVPSDRVHSELFHAEPVRRAAVAPIAGAVEGAQVTVRLDGRASDLTLAADGPSVLEAAQAVRADVPFACKGGVCGTCRARVVEGSVTMDANYALEADEVERGYVLTCQSHPTSARLVVDYDA